jgi:hypothetical protein
VPGDAGTLWAKKLVIPLQILTGTRFDEARSG